MNCPVSKTPSFHKWTQTVLEAFYLWKHCNLRFYLVATLSANQPVSNKQRLMRNSIITGGTAQKDEHIGLVTCRRAQRRGTEQQQGGHRLLGRSSWQNTEGICQRLKLILHPLQASLDLQRVVQHLHAAGVRIEPNREGAPDTGHVPPWQRYKEVRETKKVRPKELKGEVISELFMIVLQLPCLRIINPNISLGHRKRPFNWLDNVSPVAVWPVITL